MNPCTSDVLEGGVCLEALSNTSFRFCSFGGLIIDVTALRRLLSYVVWELTGRENSDLSTIFGSKFWGCGSPLRSY